MNRDTVAGVFALAMVAALVAFMAGLYLTSRDLPPPPPSIHEARDVQSPMEGVYTFTILDRQCLLVRKLLTDELTCWEAP